MDPSGRILLSGLHYPGAPPSPVTTTPTTTALTGAEDVAAVVLTDVGQRLSAVDGGERDGAGPGVGHRHAQAVVVHLQLEGARHPALVGEHAAVHPPSVVKFPALKKL